MFTTSKEEDKKFEVFPEVFMKSGPVYKYSDKFAIPQYRFYPKNGQELMAFIQSCSQLQGSDQLNYQPMVGYIADQFARQCPDNPTEILTVCGDNFPCLYDATLLNTKVKLKLSIHIG